MTRDGGATSGWRRSSQCGQSLAEPTNPVSGAPPVTQSVTSWMAALSR